MNNDVISRREESPPIVFKIKDTEVSEHVYKTYRYLLNRRGWFLSPATIGMAFGNSYDRSVGWAAVQLTRLITLKVVEKRYQFGNHQPVAYGIPLPDENYSGRYIQ